jgi:parallel beta-helix repeat protein
MHLYSSDRATVVGNVVHNNVALTDAGGGIELSNCNGSTVARNQVFENVADNYAGGVWIVSGMEDVTVVENNIYDNQAVRSSSGGLRITHLSNVVLRDNRITGNAAGTDGGGLYISTVPTVTLEGNQFYSNTATRSGGGMYLSASSPFTIVNNVIADGEAGAGGSGLYLRGTSESPTAGELVHNTLANNRHGNAGEAVYVEQYTTIALTNNLIAGHEVGLYVQPGSTNTVTADHTLFFGNEIDTDGSTIVSTDAITGQDPLFVDPDDWDYHIRLSSPAVDAGADVPWLVEDVDGDSRPFGNGYDIGADEAGPALIYLPLVVRVTA